MKKLILICLTILSISSAKTFNLIDWEPKYKYTSTEKYNLKEAKDYCDGKKNCYLECEQHSPIKCTINKTITNCHDFKIGSMDEYIGSTLKIYRMVEVCFADEKVELKHIDGEPHLFFSNKNVKYIVEKFEKYDNKSYIFKIRKRLDEHIVKFVKN